MDDELWNEVKARQAAMRRITSNGDPSRFNRGMAAEIPVLGADEVRRVRRRVRSIYWHDRSACFAARSRGTCNSNRHTISRKGS